MTRPLRIEFEHALYHITTRGNEKKNIFRSGDDYLHLPFVSYSASTNGMAFYGIDCEVLTRKKSRGNEAKKIFVYCARHYTSADLKGIASFLGGALTDTAVSKLFTRTQSELPHNKSLQKKITRIEKQLGQ